jgi:transposase
MRLAASPSSPTELSAGEWAILAPLLPGAKPGGRPRTLDLRVIFNQPHLAEAAKPLRDVLIERSVRLSNG